MILYHRTTKAGARNIFRSGFRDHSDTFHNDRRRRGVWLSEVPLDCNDGRLVLLQVELPEEIISDYEWIEDGKPHREWLLPARLVNKRAKISVAYRLLGGANLQHDRMRTRPETGGCSGLADLNDLGDRLG